MKAKLYDSKGTEKGTIELPKEFSKPIRPDILLKVFEAQKGLLMQATGSKEGAGAGYSASGILKHRRHDWKSTYGKGISRVPRKIMSRHGASFNWIGATVSNTRGGRRPHAPKSEKNMIKKINKKELTHAFISALAGTVHEQAIKEKYKTNIPTGIIFTKEILTTKTKDFQTTLKKIYGETYKHILKQKRVRAGKGTMRGRKYKTNAGLLFVTGNEEQMKRNGITIVKTKDLLISDLTPNGVPGRITAYTEQAIKEIAERLKK